jgi:hypothetical protein
MIPSRIEAFGLDAGIYAFVLFEQIQRDAEQP